MRQATWICGLLLVFSQSARADIVITANPNPFEPLPSSLFNNVWDYQLTIQGFSTTPNEAIVVYAFDVNLPVQATAIVPTINLSGSANGWETFDITNVQNVSGNTFRFTGRPNLTGIITPPLNRVIPTTPSTIATISFSVARPSFGNPDLNLQFSVTEAPVSPLLGFAPASGDGLGFYRDESAAGTLGGGATGVANVVSNLESSGPIVRPFTVSAVPEPSSIMLVGLAAGGLSLRRRRSRAA